MVSMKGLWIGENFLIKSCAFVARICRLNTKTKMLVISLETCLTGARVFVRISKAVFLKPVWTKRVNVGEIFRELVSILVLETFWQRWNL